jgi:WD40 repeat protein
MDYGNNHITTSAISITADGRYMLVGGFAKSYDLALGKIDFRTLARDTETQGDFSFTLAVSPDNQTFLITKLNSIEIWDIRSRKRSKVIKDSRLVQTAACFSKDGASIVYMRKSGELVLINSLTYKEYFNQKVTSLTPLSVGVSPDGRSLLIGTKEREIIIFDFKLKSFTDVILNDEGIRYIEFSPDGSYVAVASLNGRIWLGKYPSMDPVRSWQAHKEGQTAISFHPSGKYLASGGKDKLIRIWTIPECTQVTEWEGHKYPVASVAFTHDGGRLATGSVNDVLLRGGDDTKVWSFEAPKQYIYSGKENVQVSTAKDVIPGLSLDKTSLRKRLALVIGNGNYVGSSLANPENDARGIKIVLEQAGFEVIKYENLNQSQMKKAMDEFGEKLKNYEIGLFFYAGHGLQSKGYNYLIPVDASLRSEEQVEYDCVSADRVLALMEASGAKVNIIILDACRNNPFERSWTRAVSGKGLAFMNAPAGTVIAYATAPGNTASDGGGNNGLYTSAILETIKIPDITILQMFQKVRAIVSQKSNKQQIPWESTSLTGDFYFYQTPSGLK